MKTKLDARGTTCIYAPDGLHIYVTQQLKAHVRAYAWARSITPLTGVVIGCMVLTGTISKAYKVRYGQEWFMSMQGTLTTKIALSIWAIFCPKAGTGLSASHKLFDPFLLV